MFVGGVAGKEFVLHQTGELAEFRNVSPEKIHPVHYAQNLADLTLARHNGFENFAWFLGVTVDARDLAEPPIKQILQLRTQVEVMFLCELKYSHHLGRLPFEKVALFGMQLSIADKKRFELLFVRANERQKTKERAHAIGGAAGHELLGDSFRDAKNI